jgi:hypothetical protein
MLTLKPFAVAIAIAVVRVRVLQRDNIQVLQEKEHNNRNDGSCEQQKR